MSDQDVEVEIMREKMAAMMTGLPWRIWSALRDKDIRYFKRKYAIDRAAESLEKIQKRATKISKTGGVIAQKLIPASESNSPKYYQSDIPLIKGFAALNSSMGKLTSSEEGEFVWLIDALKLSLRAEAYIKGEGIADYLLLEWDCLSDKLKSVAAPLLINQFMATGDNERARSVYWQSVEFLTDGDDIYALATLLVGAGGMPSILPSGNLNALKLASSLEFEISESEFASVITSGRDKLRKNPQLRLLVCNFYRYSRLEIYLNTLNSFLNHYGMIRVKSVRPESFFETVEFDRCEPVSGGVKVSIVLCAYNAEKTIGCAIESILNQSYQNIEVLVADDCSDDGTVEVAIEYARKDSRVKVFAGSSNQGCYNLRNYVIRESTGELITFQDADDISIPNRIELQVRELLSGSAVACFGRWVRILEDGKFIFFKDLAALRMSVVSIMYHRSVFYLVGGYKNVRFGADTDFLERIKSEYGNDSVSVLKRPVIFGRWSESSLTQQPGQEASLDGFRGPKRRRFSEWSFMQRLLGKGVITDDMVNNALRDDGIILESSVVNLINGG
jgi:hypothetical protein